MKEATKDVDEHRLQLIDQQRTGLFAEHSGIAPITETARATIPVVEALRAAGATVTPLPSPALGYKITLGDTMPSGIIAALHNEPPHLVLRMGDEPEYPGENPDYWRQVDWTPCPVCGAPVVWYEAGYVPGYRVCSKPPHHHSQAR